MAKAGRTIAVDDQALELLASEGYSVAFGARFLKRVFDERIKLPITLHWNEGPQFHVSVTGQQIVVDAVSSSTNC